MAYIKTNWTSATPINTTNLNKIEDGIEQANGSIKETIYSDKLLGGESVTLSNQKRFLDVYVAIAFGETNGTIKYTIDTRTGYVVFGSGMQTGFDEGNMLVYYVSEGKFDRNTNTFTHTNIGFINIGTGTFSQRNDNQVYYVYRIDTYD